MVLIVMILVLGGACTYLFMQYRRVNDGQKNTAAQTAALVRQISKTVALPDEQATLATVLDKTKLGDQQLAREAHNGDLLLIYKDARLVILYRPSTHKVQDMFHIEAAQTTASPSTSTKVTK